MLKINKKKKNLTYITNTLTHAHASYSLTRPLIIAKWLCDNKTLSNKLADRLPDKATTTKERKTFFKGLAPKEKKNETKKGNNLIGRYNPTQQHVDF